MKYDSHKIKFNRIESDLVSYPEEVVDVPKYPILPHFEPSNYYKLSEICEMLGRSKTHCRQLLRKKGVITRQCSRRRGASCLVYSKKSFHKRVSVIDTVDSEPTGCVLIEDAIKMLGCSASTIRRMVKRGDIEVSSAMMRLNGTAPKKRTFITLDSIEAYFRARIRELQAEMETYERKERRA